MSAVRASPGYNNNPISCGAVTVGACVFLLSSDANPAASGDFATLVLVNIVCESGLMLIAFMIIGWYQDKVLTATK